MADFYLPPFSFMNRLKNDFIEFSKDNHLFQRGEGIQVACSGGSDSVAMLLLLDQTKDLFGVNLHCTHIDHGLRENSASDALFVEKLSFKLDVSFSCLKITDKPSGNLENWARERRHGLLEDNANKLHLVKTALAHNANDRAETLLHNIARGAGLDGAANMAPNSGSIVRPLLFASKSEILEFLTQMNQDYVTDETNSDTTFSRNRIRHNVIPQLEAIFPKAVSNISRFADLAADDSACLDEMAKACKDEVFSGNRIDVTKFSQLSKSLKRRIVRMILTGGNPPSLSLCDDAISFIEGSQTGRLIMFENINLEKVSKNIVNVSLL